MKNIYHNYITALLMPVLTCVTTVAQTDPANLKQFLTQSKYANNIKLNEFYKTLNYKSAWIQKYNADNCIVFLNTLNATAIMGLREKDYGLGFVKSFCNKDIPLLTAEDSLNAEFRLTETAMQFYNDLAFGNTKPAFGYNGLKYMPACLNIPVLLAAHISANTLRLLVPELTGSLPEITVIENKLRRFNRTINDPGFKEVIVLSNKINNANKPLVTKLYQLGIIDSVDFNLPDSMLKKKVKEVQLQFNLPADAVLRSTLLQQLNTNLSARVEQLNLSLNYYRWLNCMVQIQPVIVVNIPAAYMKVYDKNKVLLEMRMVVGKKSTPTPALISVVDEVVLYPYWHVPYKIASRELLPIFKRNPGFINTGNYQVLNMAGKIIDPGSVNWHALSPSYFPYLIRQSTGCDNALGLLKLDFDNPFGVYLHDTNGKNAFKYNRRYLSHGCMRMEKPMQLGHLILKNNRIAIDTLEQKGCLRNQSPINVHADVHMPVVVWYNPVGIDSAGRVLFYEDVYGKFK